MLPLFSAQMCLFKEETAGKLVGRVEIFDWITKEVPKCPVETNPAEEVWGWYRQGLDRRR